MILEIQNIVPGEWSVQFDVLTDAYGASEPVLATLGDEAFSTHVTAAPYSTTRHTIYFPKSGQFQIQIHAPESDLESDPVTLYFKEPEPKQAWCDKHKKAKRKCGCA